MRRVPVGALFALLLGLGVAAFAADEDSTTTGVPREQWRPMTEIIERFTGMGYQVRGIEDDDSLYEVGRRSIPTGSGSKPMWIRYRAKS
jgi:hypothetical protein